MRANLPNSLPRGNLVDGVPRAASFLVNLHNFFDVDFHEKSENSDFHDFSSKFCLSMRIILRVRRASDDEF